MNALAELRTASPASCQIYLVITQTGTWLSRILKAVTGAEYNHVSLSLSPDLTAMYSFGRVHPYNPFWAGFVVESARGGTFKRFRKTEAVVLSVPVSEESFCGISRAIEGMLAERSAYHYNFAGLVLAGLNIHYRKSGHYYCSEFVKEILAGSDVEGAEQLAAIVKPIHFLSMPNSRRVYRGYLRDYPGEQGCVL